MSMFLISFSIIKITSWYFLKIKTPMNPGGNLKRCFSKTEYPRRLNKFLLTASLATLFGAIKEICGVVESLFNLNLKVKKEELTDLQVPSWVHGGLYF